MISSIQTTTFSFRRTARRCAAPSWKGSGYLSRRLEFSGTPANPTLEEELVKVIRSGCFNPRWIEAMPAPWL